MAHPHQEHIALTVDQVQACADLAARLYVVASGLLWQARHHVSPVDDHPLSPPGNVYDLDAQRALH